MKAMVLCAGLGTRLGALTERCPKPLLEIGGQPLLARTLRYLAQQGITVVVVNLHHLPEAVTAAIGDGSAFGLRVTYSHEPELRGTAGGVKLAAPLLEDPDPIVVMYGDLLLDAPLAPMLAQHRAAGAAATILVHRRARSNSIVTIDERRRVVAFAERPPEDEHGDDPVWVNSGLYVLDPSVPPALPDVVPLDFPRDVFPGLVAGGALYAFPLDGHRVAIDSPERLDEARALFDSGALRWPA